MHSSTQAFLESIKQAVKQLIQPSHHHHHHHHHQHQAVEQDDDDDDGGEEDDDDENDDATLTRDEFNLNKIIVAVTSVGKVAALISAFMLSFILCVSSIFPFNHSHPP